MHSSEKTLNKKELSSLKHLTITLLTDDEESQKIRYESNESESPLRQNWPCSLCIFSNNISDTRNTRYAKGMIILSLSLLFLCCINRAFKEFRPR